MAFEEKMEHIKDKAKEDWEQTKDDAREAWDSATSALDSDDHSE